MEFYKLKSNAIVDNALTGKAIIKVSKSVNQNTPGSEWDKFSQNTRKWLKDNGYVYPGTADGMAPPDIELVVVCDTATKIHVRVPYIGDLENTPVQQDEPSYGNSFPAFLARYFIRRCR